jgi:hypothetical protein
MTEGLNERARDNETVSHLHNILIHNKQHKILLLNVYDMFFI